MDSFGISIIIDIGKQVILFNYTKLAASNSIYNFCKTLSGCDY